MASQLLGLNSSGDLFVGVLGSQTVEDRMVDRFKLMDVYSARYRKDAREKLEDNTDIKSDRKTGLISISVEDRRPERAAEMAKAYVDELNRALAEVNTSAAHRERVFIESRLKEIKEELDASAKEFAVFASQNAAIDVPSQAQAMVQSAATLQGQLIAAQSELKGFEQIYTSNNIRVKTMKAHVAELEHQLAKFSGTEVDPAKDPSLAKGELYPSVRQLPLLGVKYLDLFRRTKIDEAVFELLTKGYEIAKVQEAREVPTVQVLDVATVPEKKTSPHRLLIMLGGALLGFALTAGYLISERLWKSTNDSDSAKALTRDILWSVKSQVERAPGYPKFRRGFQRIAPILGTRRNELNGH
jgi:capsule polysaccharide export protein KpsE/RkpR